MELGKSLGIDSFQAKSYSRFWDLFGCNLEEILKFLLHKGFLSALQHLLLLFKKDDPLSLKNWQPILLLNLDYKITTKTLLVGQG